MKSYRVGWVKTHMGHNSAIWPQMQKTKALYFLRFGKLEKIKCPYFLDQRSYEGFTAIQAQYGQRQNQEKYKWP